MSHYEQAGQHPPRECSSDPSVDGARDGTVDESGGVPIVAEASAIAAAATTLLGVQGGGDGEEALRELGGALLVLARACSAIGADAGAIEQAAHACGELHAQARRFVAVQRSLRRPADAAFNALRCFTAREQLFVPGLVRSHLPTDAAIGRARMVLCDLDRQMHMASARSAALGRIETVANELARATSLDSVGIARLADTVAAAERIGVQPTRAEVRRALCSVLRRLDSERSLPHPLDKCVAADRSGRRGAARRCSRDDRAGNRYQKPCRDLSRAHREARLLGLEWGAKRRTGEVRYLDPRTGRRQVVNGRRKDVPRSLERFVRAARRARDGGGKAA